jgi:endonuclease G
MKKLPPIESPRPKGPFLTDMRTKAKVTHDDFTGSGYDRGHLTPNSAIARAFGPEAQLETFLMSNICPQAPKLNQDVWEDLERAEHDYAFHAGEIWVIAGPIFDDLQPNGKSPKKLRSGVQVPDAFFKILVQDKTGGRGLAVRSFSVIMPQTVKGTEPFSQFTTTIKQIESQTGLEFLAELDPRIRNQLVGEKNPPWTHRN